jgi:hypothetical protein
MTLGGELAPPSYSASLSSTELVRIRGVSPLDRLRLVYRYAQQVLSRVNVW